MKSICLFLSVVFSFPVLAAPFNIKNYKFQKDVKLNSTSNTEDSQKIARILLDEELYKNSFYGDLRLTANELPVPYRRNPVKVKNQTEETVEVTKVINKREDNQRTVVLELPKLQKDYVYTSITAIQEGYDEASIQVSTGTTPDQMSSQMEVFLYSYSDKPNNTIKIGPTKHRFVRIVMSSTSQIKFESATKEKIQTNAYFSKEAEKIEEERIEDKMIYSISNPNRTPITDLKLNFKDSKFERELKVEHFKNGKKWEVVFDSRVSFGDADDPNVYLPLNEMISNDYRITITNGENPPLTLTKVTELQTKEELVFFLPENASEIKLYYGNRYARDPDFDPFLIPETNLEPNTTASLSEGIENPDFSFSIVEPPVSGYIANAIFYLGIIVLLGIGFSFFQKMKKPIPEKV